MKGKRPNPYRQWIKSTIVLSGFLIVVLISSTTMGNLLIKHSRSTGENLVKIYSINQESNIAAYEALLSVGADYIDTQKKEVGSITELRKLVAPYLESMIEQFTEGTVDVYGMVNGELLTTDPKKQWLQDYDFTQTVYYKGAKLHPGEIYTSPVYADYLTNEPVVTFAKMMKGSDDFLAMDICFRQIQKVNEKMELPQNASFFLVGAEGRVIYYFTPLELSYDACQVQIDSLWEDIRLEQENSYVDYVSSVDGQEKTAYFHRLNNGWTAILTISNHTIISEVSQFRNGMVLLSLLVVIGLIWLSLINYKRDMITMKLQEEKEAANQAKSQLFSNISHDIRTPMNTIISSANLAYIQLDNPQKVKESLEYIIETGKHLQGLINQILHISKIESGTMVLCEKGVVLDRLISKIIGMFETPYNGKKLTIKVTRGIIKHPVVYCDDDKVIEILGNILGNAVKYTPKGGTVEIVYRELFQQKDKKNGYEFFIIDNGIGMGEDLLATIFDPFAQGMIGEVTAEKGVGLGLPIARSMAQLMDGDIQVESSLGEGTKFRVVLYFEPYKEMKASEGKEPSSFATEIDSFQKHTYEGKRILLVEDNEINALLTKELLETVGVIVDIACNGKEAVERFQETPQGYYQLIFMDIRMPVMNGYEATVTIRQMERDDAQNIPIVAITADAFPDDVKKTTAAGMNAHLSKPVDLGKLESILQSWL